MISDISSRQPLATGKWQTQDIESMLVLRLFNAVDGGPTFIQSLELKPTLIQRLVSAGNPLIPR